MQKLKVKILFTLNIIAGVALLLAYLSVAVNPVKIAFLAFFGLAYPYLLLLNIIFIIIWAVNFKKQAFISLIIILIGLNHFNNYIRFQKAETGEFDFSLLSYNIRLFNHYDKDKNSEKEIINYLKSSGTDILCLQEFYINGNVSSLKERFALRINSDYKVHSKFFPIKDSRHYGIAIFTVFPIVGYGDIKHPSSASLSIYTDIVIKKDTFRIYNNHLQSFKLRGMERTLIEEIYSSDQENTMKGIMDLSLSLKQGFAGRANQADTVRKHINASPYPVIVCGDFNDTPVSYTYHKIRKGLRDSFVESGSGAGFTYTGKYPANRIDYILFDKKLISSGFHIDRIKYSDHYPVTAFFRIRD
ncbi:MAG: endonuclease/exonuclease/phosphatase family protein [Bacteroidales bacterium]|nr:endonuclease/exonuclease/phosphatase family protein [Bacteroidales bacterium]